MAQRCSGAEDNAAAASDGVEEKEVLRPYERAVRQLEEDEMEIKERQLNNQNMGKRAKGAWFFSKSIIAISCDISRYSSSEITS